MRLKVPPLLPLCGYLLLLVHFSQETSSLIGDSGYPNDFQNFHEREKRSVQLQTPKPEVYTLPANYSVHEPPPKIDGKAVPVDFSILIFDVFDINELQGNVGLEVNLKMYWRDTRLENWTGVIREGQKYTVLSPALITQIWHPDSFIDHMKGMAQPSLISKAASLRVYEDGSLRYSARMLITMSCQMDFRHYPADTQKCPLDIKSYGYSTDHITLSWREGLGPSMAYAIDVHNFDVALATSPDYVQVTKSATYSAIQFTLFLRRKLSYHVIQTFIPSALFTIVSWLSFLVPPESTPGRMAICVTTLLTLTAMFSSVRQNTPRVSYIKALDLWMVTCIIFVFSVLAEYTTVLKLRSMKDKTNKKSRKSKRPRDQDSQHLQLQSPIKSTTFTTSPNPTADPGANNAGSGGGSGGGAAEISSSGSSPQHLIKRNHFLLDFSPTEKDKTIVDPLLSSRPMTPTSTSISMPASPVKPPPSPAKENENKPSKYFQLACKFEKYVPRIMPLCFLVFNFLYWPILLSVSEYYNLRIDSDMFYSV